LISTRALTVSILGEDYLIFAKSKGLKNTKILNRYILRNTLLPQITGLAMSLGFIVNGSLMVEWIFSYPGLGSALIYAMQMLDYNVIQAIIFLSMLTVLFANFLIDVLYPLVDPRIRHGG
jgi:peptide/nickel transport system permease protein